MAVSCARIDRTPRSCRLTPHGWPGVLAVFSAEQSTVNRHVIKAGFKSPRAWRRRRSSMDMAEKEWQMSARQAGSISKQEGGL